MPVTFKDIRLPLQLGGFPEVRWLEEERLAISDWSGRLFGVEANFGGVVAVADLRQPRLPVGETLTSLCSAPGSPARCAVATRAGWGWVWTPGNDRLLRIAPQGGGPVNSVTLSRDGKDLLIGTGYYPLSGAQSVARVERWTLDPEPTFRAEQKLLGAAVDCIDWDPHTGTIAALLGAVSQDRGYLVLLDEADLQIREILETGVFHCSAIRLAPEGERVVFVHRHGVERRYLSEFTFRERFLEVSEDISGAHISESANHVLLSNGQLYSVASDETIDLPGLPDVAATAFGPRGIIYGVTGEGLLRTWQTSIQ